MPRFLPFGAVAVRLCGRACKAGLTPADFPRRLLREGMRVEAEHSDDPAAQAWITADHLTEDRRYYRKLKRVHLEAE